MIPTSNEPSHRNGPLGRWVQAVARHATPGQIHWCDGGEQEQALLVQALWQSGEGPLAPGAPGGVAYPVGPAERAGAVQSFLCTDDREDAGPAGEWLSQRRAKEEYWPRLAGAMAGRTMYVVPYLLGPVGSSFSRVGVEVTDSARAALLLRVMARVGPVALDHVGPNEPFVRGVHSLGAPGGARFLVHFPRTQEIWSLGSGRGVEAALSMRSHALCLASAQAQDEGWLAGRMALLSVTSPAGETHHIAAAFPQGCGLSSLASLSPSRPGWRVSAAGDGVCWLRVGWDGRLWALNPERGVFHRRAQGESAAPLRQPGDPGGINGVPLSAIVFGTRRSGVAPLVYEAHSWARGVHGGATLVREDSDGRPRFDPMGMASFCGANLGDALAGWLAVGSRLAAPPRVFHVNWFRVDRRGALLWPGYDENFRVLRWVIGRVTGEAAARDTAIGLVPTRGSLDLGGLGLPPGHVDELLAVDGGAWLQESGASLEFLGQLGRRLPRRLIAEHNVLTRRLCNALC